MARPRSSSIHKAADLGRESKLFNFGSLVQGIQQIHDQCVRQASQAVNISLTLRNWLIGCYVCEYEQNGFDRAEYGANLLEKLSKGLVKLQIDGVAPRSLRLYRLFYLSYPQIWQTPSAKSFQVQTRSPIWQTVSAKSMVVSKAVEMVRPKLQISGEKLLEKLSFSHFAELLSVDDIHKRVFYEMECIRGHWSVRELKRQIGSLYFERSALSKDKKKLVELVKCGAEKAETGLAIRDPYVFEFLGIKSREVMRESDLEDALLQRLEEFLLELGHGFCFEARQKQIRIGNKTGFVDLVFYHRILKCHVLVELKIQEFNHENIGQLNTYVNWYRKNMLSEGDGPPVGILLCTQKDQTLVEYALAGMDNNLFVSKYQLELPKKEEMQKFVENQMKEVG